MRKFEYSKNPTPMELEVPVRGATRNGKPIKFSNMPEYTCQYCGEPTVSTLGHEQCLLDSVKFMNDASDAWEEE
mgnify:CR=1 FL=1